MATRCCWPPDSCPGYLPACSGMRTRSRYCMASSSAVAPRPRPRTHMGDRVQFSSTVRCGNRLKCWNTIPTSRRTVSMFLTSLVSSTPSTTRRPRWCSSSRLMQRIRVDLPEAGRPANDHPLAARHVHVDVVEHVQLAVPLVQTLHVHHRSGVGGHTDSPSSVRKRPLSGCLLKPTICAVGTSGCVWLLISLNHPVLSHSGQGNLAPFARKPKAIWHEKIPSDSHATQGSRCTFGGIGGWIWTRTTRANTWTWRCRRSGCAGRSRSTTLAST